MADRVLSEVDIETKVCEWAEKNGWLAPKLQWINQTGWPDRTFMKNGKIIFIEFKKPGGVTSKKQKYWIKQIWSQGFYAYVIDNVEDALYILKHDD